MNRGEERDRIAAQENYSVIRQSTLVRLEGNETSKSDTVTEELETADSVAEEEHGTEDEEDVLDDTGECQGQRASGANEEDGSNVETESNASVGEEHKGAQVGDLEEGDQTLGEGEHHSVDRSANGSKVVKRDKRVHLEALQKYLDHNEARRFESDSEHLADETRHGKVALTIRSERH